MNYPEPKHNPHCQCKANPLQAFYCQFGHMTECHYPYTCNAAACSHLPKYDFTPAQVTQLEARARQAILAGQMPPYDLDSKGNVFATVKPTATAPDQGPATLEKIVRTLTSNGGDRGTLVAEDKSPPAMVIFLLSSAATRDCGPVIDRFIRQHFSHLPQSADTGIRVHWDSHCATIFKVMAELNQPWMYFFPSPVATVVFIQSPVIDKDFAAELTKRGCITNLK